MTSVTSATVEALPAQAEFIDDTTSRIAGYVGGWGAGKTFAAVWKALTLALANPGVDGIIAEPFYSQVTHVLIPTLYKVFEMLGISHLLEIHRRDGVATFQAGGRTYRILLKNASNPETLAGINAGWAVVDECALIQDEVFSQIAARVREPCPVPQLALLGTPDQGKRGFFYERLEGNPSPKTKLYRSKTTDNPFLDADYVETNLAHLSEQERRRYVNGEFCEFFGRVYSEFSESVHLLPCPDPLEGEQFLAIDFGFGCSAWLFGRIVSGVIHITGEQILEQRNTIQGAKIATQYLAQRNKNHGHVILTARELAASVKVYCDPAGSEKYKGSSSDVAILRDAGFERVYHQTVHPKVADRVAAVQFKLRAKELFIDPEKAPLTARAMRDQAYDDSGAPEKSKGRIGAKGTDHPMDALGYLTQYRFPVQRARVGAFQI